MNEEYLTEEELNKLIHSVEEERMLKAPSYLKSEVLMMIEQERQQEEHKHSKRQLMFFELKMIGGIAAAIWMLLLMPVTVQGESSVTENRIEAETQDFFHACGQRMDEMLEGVGWVTDLLMKPMQNPDEKGLEQNTDAGGTSDGDDSEAKPGQKKENVIEEFQKGI